MADISLSRLAGQARRRVAAWAAPELRDDLTAARKQLKAAKRRLRRIRAELAEVRGELAAARAELAQARDRLSEVEAALPADVEEVIGGVTREHLSYLQPQHLRSLAVAVVDAEQRGVPGLVIEAGTARGGSAIVMAAAKDPARPMKVFDVFGRIPPPTEEDGPDVHERYAAIVRGEARGVGGETYYGYRDDLRAEVAASFARHGLPLEEHSVELVAGLFQDTIHLDEPVAVAHLDGDWYASTMTCLERIAPLVSPSGRLIFDDYYKWSGCRTAVDEYFATRDDFELRHGAKLHAVRR